jgi:hypothetical protein
MYQKLFNLLLVYALLTTVSYAGGHNKADVRISQLDATPVNLYPYNYNMQSVVFRTPPLAPSFVTTDSITVGPEILTGSTGFDDYKTNGEVNHFLQVDPGTPDNLQATDVQTDSTDPTGVTTRRTKYCISSDGGATWQFVTDVPSGRRSGFPVIDLLNGAAVIANHNVFPASVLDAILYVDAAPEVGTFTEYNFATHAPFGIWPQIATLSNGNVAMLSRRNVSSSDLETLYVNLWNGSTLQSRTSFYQTTGIYNGAVGSNMQFQIASNGAGEVTGVAYPVLQNDVLGTAKMFARTSTDNGATWGALSEVYTPHMIGSDPYGAAGGIDLVYKPNSTTWFLSYVETKDSVGNIFYENTLLKVRRSDGTTSTLTDVATVGATTGFALTMSFVWNIDNPALGWSRDGKLLYCVYTVVKSDLGASGYNERDLYFQYSTDDAATWSQPIRLTNTTDIDECYPSVSIYNKGNVTTGETYELNMAYMKDPGVGPTTFGGSAPASRNDLIYRKISFGPPIGIHNIGSTVPKAYSLNQNYPNPFNPSTKIRFDLPKNSFVTLKVYDITGRLVSTLLNENLAAGTKEYDWNAINMPSGVYFYTIKAGDFTQTKKMILVK